MYTKVELSYCLIGNVYSFPTWANPSCCNYTNLMVIVWEIHFVVNLCCSMLSKKLQETFYLEYCNNILELNIIQ